MYSDWVLRVPASWSIYANSIGFCGFGPEKQVWGVGKVILRHFGGELWGAESVKTPKNPLFRGLWGPFWVYRHVVHVFDSVFRVEFNGEVRIGF